jgi:predicted CopG family antitoxin
MPASTPCLRISPENRERLNKLKIHPKESYDTVIGRLLDRMNDPEPLTDEDRLAIAESLEEIRDGTYYTLKEAKKELGLP